MFTPLYLLCRLLVAAAVLCSSLEPAAARAEGADLLSLPAPGTLVGLSRPFTPAELKGMTVNPAEPFKFDFLVRSGDGPGRMDAGTQEYAKLIQYFLAALTVPDQDQWVNLSPYESDRTVEADFGRTGMGRDLLAQDYLLKQVASSLLYPEASLGKTFWAKVYALARGRYGRTDVPVNTFNKVWIVPDQALIYEQAHGAPHAPELTAYVVKSHLKVMLEEDYTARYAHQGNAVAPARSGHPLAGSMAIAPIVRGVILPVLEKEVNEGKNFAPLRQVFSAMLLATWYKRALKQSLLAQGYADRRKVAGVMPNDMFLPGAALTVDDIYDRYLQAFKKGVYNYIRDDADAHMGRTAPRKYFAGGISNAFSRQGVLRVARDGEITSEDRAMAARDVPQLVEVTGDFRPVSMTRRSFLAGAVASVPARAPRAPDTYMSHHLAPDLLDVSYLRRAVGKALSGNTEALRHSLATLPMELRGWVLDYRRFLRDIVDQGDSPQKGIGVDLSSKELEAAMERYPQEEQAVRNALARLSGEEVPPYVLDGVMIALYGPAVYAKQTGLLKAELVPLGKDMDTQIRFRMFENLDGENAALAEVLERNAVVLVQVDWALRQLLYDGRYLDYGALRRNLPPEAVRFIARFEAMMKAQDNVNEAHQEMIRKRGQLYQGKNHNLMMVVVRGGSVSLEGAYARIMGKRLAAPDSAMTVPEFLKFIKDKASGSFPAGWYKVLIDPEFEEIVGDKLGVEGRVDYINLEVRNVLYRSASERLVFYYGEKKGRALAYLELPRTYITRIEPMERPDDQKMSGIAPGMTANVQPLLPETSPQPKKSGGREAKSRHKGSPAVSLPGYRRIVWPHEGSLAQAAAHWRIEPELFKPWTDELHRAVHQLPSMDIQSSPEIRHIMRWGMDAWRTLVLLQGAVGNINGKNVESVLPVMCRVLLRELEAYQKGIQTKAPAPAAKGGIDLNAAHFALQVRGDMNPRMMARLPSNAALPADVDGLVPAIIDIRPARSVLQNLHVFPQRADLQGSHARS